jgi:hypothetical protein
MLDFVAAHEDKAPAGVDGCRIQNLKARLAIPSAAHEGRRGAVAHHPEYPEKAQKGDANAAGCEKKTAAIGPGNVVKHFEILRFFPNRATPLAKTRKSRGNMLNLCNFPYMSLLHFMNSCASVVSHHSRGAGDLHPPLPTRGGNHMNSSPNEQDTIADCRTLAVCCRRLSRHLWS